MELSTLMTIFSLCFTILWYLYRKSTYWSRNGVTGPSYIQSLFRMTKPLNIDALENGEKYGPIYGYYDLNGLSIAVNDPELIKNIMVKDFHIFRDHRLIHWGDERFGSNVFAITGDDRWRKIRSLMTPAFTTGKLKNMSEPISNITDTLINNLNSLANTGKLIDIKHSITCHTLDVIAKCCYGITTDSFQHIDHPLVKNVLKFFNLNVSFSMIMSVLFPKLSKLLDLQPFDHDAVKYLSQVTVDIVNERKKLDMNKINNDLMQFLSKNLDISDKNNNLNGVSDKINDKLTMTEYTAQGITFFLAGTDTTTSTLSHLIYYLCAHEECQQKLHNEIMTVDDITHESLANLKYLNAVIDETLRLEPPLTAIERTAQEDYTLGDTGIVIPKGTVVTFYPHSLHRDPRYFHNPKQFIPERFIDNTLVHPYSFIPFGGGPRMCIGFRFALNEMRMCIAKMIKNFRFYHNPDTKLEYFAGQMIAAPKEVMVFIDRRSESC